MEELEGCVATMAWDWDADDIDVNEHGWFKAWRCYLGCPDEIEK